MAKIKLDISDILKDPEVRIYGNPFGKGQVIGLLPFKKGEQPPHLVPYRIPKGLCAGQTGVVVYKGKVIPKTAACVAEWAKGGRRT